MKARRVVEDVLVPMTIVAPPPATVTQRNCFEHFGISKSDYLRMVADGAFPVRPDGQLRIAAYDDVKAYLTTGAATTRRRARGQKEAPSKPDPNDLTPGFDATAALRKAGFRLR